MSRCLDTCRKPSPAQAHCKATDCHVTFATVTDFDRHRRDGRCLPPESIGLVERDGLWASPESHSHRAVLGERMADVRSQRATPTPEPRTAGIGTHGEGAGE